MSGFITAKERAEWDRLTYEWTNLGGDRLRRRPEYSRRLMAVAVLSYYPEPGDTPEGLTHRLADSMKAGYRKHFTKLHRFGMIDPFTWLLIAKLALFIAELIARWLYSRPAERSARLFGVRGAVHTLVYDGRIE